MYLRRAYLRIMFICGLCLCSIMLFFANSPRAFAADDPITVTTRTETLTFPRAIDFQMHAYDSNASPTQATLFIKYNNGSFGELHQVNASTHTNQADFTWHDDLLHDHFTPVSTRISYYWLITDSANNTHTDTVQTFLVQDNRFQWQHVDQGLVQVNWYNRSADFGAQVAARVNYSLKQIQSKLGIGLQDPITVWIYATVDDFHTSLPPKTSEWVGGIAFPQLNQASIVVENMDDTTLRRDMPHELTHLVFHQEAQAYVPTWFDEGLAVYNQFYQEPELTLRFKDALSNHTLLNLTNISMTFPSDTNQAYLAYAQSWKLLDYMYSSFGQNKMSLLIQDLHSSDHTFDEDLQQSIGIDTAQLENQWRLSLNQPPLPSDNQSSEIRQLSAPMPNISTTDSMQPLLIDIGILLIILPFLGCVGFLAVQKRYEQRLAHAQAMKLRPGSPFPGYGAPGQIPYNRYPPSNTYPAPGAYMQPGNYYPQYPAYPQQYPSYPPYPPGPHSGPEAVGPRTPRE